MRDHTILVAGAIVALLYMIPGGGGGAEELVEPFLVEQFGNTLIITYYNTQDVAYFSIQIDGADINSSKSGSEWEIERTDKQSVKFLKQGNGHGETKFSLALSNSVKEFYYKSGDGDKVIAEGSYVLVSEEKPAPQSSPKQSTLKILPAKPNIGGSIRVIGSQYESDTEYTFYIADKKIETFTSNNKGDILGTIKIPSDITPGRIVFRLGDAPTYTVQVDYPRGIESEEIKLALNHIPTIHRGDHIPLGGTAVPNQPVIISIINPDYRLITKKSIRSDYTGMWETESIKTKFDSTFGTYTVTISDGKTEYVQRFNLTSDRIMDITAITTGNDPGDVIKFTGTAAPDTSIHLTMENPLGHKVGSKSYITNGTGRIYYEYETDRSSPPGLYTLIAVQNDQTELVNTYIGKRSKFAFNMELDRTSYGRGDTIRMSVQGEPSDRLKLRIIGERAAYENATNYYNGFITLDPEGRGSHQIELTNVYTKGTYSAILSKGNIADAEKFGVNLGANRVNLEISTTKFVYDRGDEITILGSTVQRIEGDDGNKKRGSSDCTNSGRNISLHISIIDPSGNTVLEKDTFIDKNCQILDRTFKIPDDAETGIWSLASSIQKSEEEQKKTNNQRQVNNIRYADDIKYEDCLPFQQKNKIAIIACKTKIGGIATPVIRVIDKDGEILFQNYTVLVNEIYDTAYNTLNITKAENVIHKCQDLPEFKPLEPQTEPMINLMEITQMTCPYGYDYKDMAECVQKNATPKLTHNEIDTNILGTQVIKYTCTGNDFTITAERRVEVTDQTKPVIDLVTGSVKTLEIGDPYIEHAICTDNIDPNPVLKGREPDKKRTQETGVRHYKPIDAGMLGPHTITYTCTDDAGNTAQATRTVLVKKKCPEHLDKVARAKCRGLNQLSVTAGHEFVSNFRIVNLDDDSLRVSVKNVREHNAGKVVEILVQGSKKNTVLTIMYEFEDEDVHKHIIRDGSNEYTYHWRIDRKDAPGLYTITATHGTATDKDIYYIPLQ